MSNTVEEANERIEVWKPIPNYEGIYEVSDLGNVVAVERYAYNKNGIKIKNPRKVRKPQNQSGYLKLLLFKDGNKRTYLVHQLVAMAFLGHVPSGRDIQIDHKNDNRSDNRLENIQILTRSDNEKKRYLRSIREQNANMHTILKLNGKSKTLTEWAAEYGLERHHIRQRMRLGWSVERAITEPLRRKLKAIEEELNSRL